MTLRADHVAGALFILLGVIVFAVSSELPFGRVSAPGAGMMPKLVTGLMMIFAGALVIAARAGRPFIAIDWSDRGHAMLVVVISAIAIALYQPLGFIITMALLVFGLLVIVERRNILIAAGYSLALTFFAYWLFGIALKSPLERGIFWL